MLCVSEPPVLTSKTQKYSFLLPRFFGCVDVNKPNNILVSLVFNTVQTVDGNFWSDPELSGTVCVNLSTICRYVRQNSKMTLTFVTAHKVLTWMSHLLMSGYKKTTAWRKLKRETRSSNLAFIGPKDSKVSNCR